MIRIRFRTRHSVWTAPSHVAKRSSSATLTLNILQDERALLAKHADRPGVLGPVETFMLAIAAVPRAAQRLQAERLQRSFADRLTNAQARFSSAAFAAALWGRLQRRPRPCPAHHLPGQRQLQTRTTGLFVNVHDCTGSIQTLLMAFTESL